jgi:hypothetical protein
LQKKVADMENEAKQFLASLGAKVQGPEYPPLSPLERAVLSFVTAVLEAHATLKRRPAEQPSVMRTIRLEMRVFLQRVLVVSDNSTRRRV